MRVYFSIDDQLRVLDTATHFSDQHSIEILHETHRGRLAFSPGNFGVLYNHRPDLALTADFSHWVCVTESLLENFKPELSAAISRSRHIHARVGHTQGPQISDPRSSYWQQELSFFLNTWKKIIDYQRNTGADSFTITPEFGPPPYMWTNVSDNSPVVEQWDVNVFMKNLLKNSLK